MNHVFGAFLEVCQLPSRPKPAQRACVLAFTSGRPSDTSIVALAQACGTSASDGVGQAHSDQQLGQQSSAASVPVSAVIDNYAK
jgi:hypothetical protein